MKSITKEEVKEFVDLVNRFDELDFDLDLEEKEIRDRLWKELEGKVCQEVFYRFYEMFNSELDGRSVGEIMQEIIEGVMVEVSDSIDDLSEPFSNLGKHILDEIVKPFAGNRVTFFLAAAIVFIFGGLVGAVVCGMVVWIV